PSSTRTSTWCSGRPGLTPAPRATCPRTSWSRRARSGCCRPSRASPPAGATISVPTPRSRSACGWRPPRRSRRASSGGSGSWSWMPRPTSGPRSRSAARRDEKRPRSSSPRSWSGRRTRRDCSAKWCARRAGATTRNCSSSSIPRSCSRSTAMGRRTPLHDRHVALGARMVDFAGWEMPQQYSSVREEQAAVRTAAALFDVSHMGRADLVGERAGEFLQRLLTNDVSTIASGRAQYNLMCNHEGGILDDLIVYRDDSGWSMVFNAGNREKDLAWMRGNADGVEVVDRSDEIGLLALQGPEAEAVLRPLTDVDLSRLPYFGLTRGTVARSSGARIARTGYTGED